jgi:uncharacterized membrane protein YkoI
MNTKTRAFTATVLAAGLVATGAFAAGSPSASLKGGELAPQAKITLAVARASALKARPGAITDQELEKEKGGSGLRYSFDIKHKAKTYEVGVDAQTGAVLETAPEGKNPD